MTPKTCSDTGFLISIIIFEGGRIDGGDTVFPIRLASRPVTDRRSVLGRGLGTGEATRENIALTAFKTANQRSWGRPIAEYKERSLLRGMGEERGPLLSGICGEIAS